MVRDKFFKIAQIKLNNGETIFKVYGCENKAERFFNIWSGYAQENKTFEAALEHIEYLSKRIPLEIRTVYSTRFVFSKESKNRVKANN